MSVQNLFLEQIIGPFFPCAYARPWGRVALKKDLLCLNARFIEKVKRDAALARPHDFPLLNTHFLTHAYKKISVLLEVSGR